MTLLQYLAHETLPQVGEKAHEVDETVLRTQEILG